MNIRPPFYVLIIFIAASCAHQTVVPSPRDEILLSGDDWSLLSYSSGRGVKDRAFERDFETNWAITARVPGDIYWDLERAKKIPNLYYGMNIRDSRWVMEKEWWYRKAFKVSESWSGKVVRLRFEGVDYLADFWLNGHYLGQHQGQFTPFEFDVSDNLLFGRENILAVLIHPVPGQVRKVVSEDKNEWEIMSAMRAAYPYWKSMTSSGWDFGADLISMGIWQDVRLIATKDIYISILNVFPTVHPPYKSATLKARMNMLGYKAKHVKLVYNVKCLTDDDQSVIIKKEYQLSKGDQVVEETLDIRRPKLWWPNGYGRQNLYKLVVTAYDSEKNDQLDQISTIFGIRDLKMLVNPRSPEYNDYTQYYPLSPDFAYKPPRIIEITDSTVIPKYIMQINGKRIMGMGANWLPGDLLFGRTNKEFYEHLIRLAAKANFNLFRIWGGGIVEKQMFFDLCDRYGIMLFAEFPNGGIPLPENDQALKITASEIRQILPLMINHPCVVRYGGGNEWYTNDKNSRQMAQLRQICNEVDSTRPFHDPDPECVGQRHGPYEYENNTIYQVYNSGHPMNSGPDDPMEWTEYGVSGASSIKSLKRIMPEESLWPIELSDPYWIWHNGLGAFGETNQLWLLPSQYLNLFGNPSDLENTIRCSQFVQAEGLRYANQSMRRNQWHRSAFTSWTLNEPWPNAAHGCLVEYYGQPKMAYYYVKKTCLPVDVSCVYSNLECSLEKPLDVEVWYSNNNTRRMSNNTLRWHIYGIGGEICYEGTKIVNFDPEKSEIVDKIMWRPSSDMGGEVALLYLELLDPEGKLLVDHLYTFGIRRSNLDSLKQTKPTPPLKALLHALPTTLDVQTVNFRYAGSGNVKGQIEVENTGNNVGLFVELNTDVPGKTRAYFSDNYFFLARGQRHLITADIISENSNEEISKIKLSAKAWNSPLQNLDVIVK